MTLEADAWAKRSEALSPRPDTQLGLEGEYWEHVITRDGQEVFRSPLVQKIELLGDEYFLPGLFGGSFSLWLVGRSYLNGIRSRQEWMRLPRSIIFQKDGVKVVVSPRKPESPPPERTVRRRLYSPAKGRRGKRVHPTRFNYGRPSPEIVTKNRVSCWNRDGTFMSLTSVPYNTFHRTWSGTVTSGFKTMKKKRLPINPHHVLIWEQSEPSQYYSRVHKTDIHDSNWFVEFFGDPGTLNLPGSISHDESARFQAIRRIIDRTENGIEGNVAQDIVQLNQVVRTMQDPIDRITRAVKHIRGKNIPGAVDVLWNGRPPKYRKGNKPHAERPLADNWLAMQYGWKPLLQDVHGATESLARFNFADYSVRQVKASGKSKAVTRTPIVSYTGHEAGVVHTVVTSRCKIGLRYTLDNRLTSFLQQTGFTNPINLFWEVLPYSFVVDWFLPIGPYLETLSAWDGLVFLDGFQTQFTRKVHQAVVGGSWVSGNYVHTVSGDYEAEGILLDRIKLTSFPSAVFPSFKNPISTEHVLNSLALMVSAFSGGRHPRSD